MLDNGNQLPTPYGENDPNEIVGQNFSVWYLRYQPTLSKGYNIYIKGRGVSRKPYILIGQIKLFIFLCAGTTVKTLRQLSQLCR